MRTKHTSHPLSAFPVYSCAFVSSNEFVLGGGGGQSRSGIKNKLRLYRAENDKKLELLQELELESGEDAPMSMAAHPKNKDFACGVNSSAENMRSGDNQNCRLYSVEDHKIKALGSRSTLVLKEAEDDFQKVTVFSPDGILLAVSGSRDLSLLYYPSLSPAALPVHLDKGEIYDASFSAKTLVIATTVNLLVYALPSSDIPEKSDKATGKQKQIPPVELCLLKTVDRPNLPGKDAGGSFRSVRYHPLDENTLYTVINTIPPRTRTKSTPRRAFICKWNAETWEVIRSRKVGDRGLTCFDVSPNGKLLAFGSADYTVGILDAQTLAPLLDVLKAHEFPPTTLRFNTTSNLLISGSADSTVRIVTIPDTLAAASWSSWILIIVTLLVIIFAILAQQMHHHL
ncbi:WD40 repeat-like protein [Sparassis latifolia]|uniref:Guanine nucleotide-exchange factor SEC12 n=1 Tax=Sparassis crispa TaxID=139825 RepID=A0A401GB38_9APHY|nr:Guanine nucleotide-exchange factor SEC12 [Sparassis crispa]GBE79367.1 Guanine nucleotide-exchange factor SEC12 [Sparassis crispa]